MRSLVFPAVLLTMACHAVPPPRPLAPPLPVTVFLAADDELPEVAAALNARVRGVYPPGPTVRYAAVSVEDAQMVVGCMDATIECWSALADPVSTTGLLVAEARLEGRDGGVRLSVRFFDGGSLRTLRLSERVYRSAASAIDGVPDLVGALAVSREEP